RGQGSQRRLVVLQIFLGIVLVGIGVRVLILQAFLRERFLAVWSQSTELTQPLGARSGRILTRDGAVLAYDETRYDLAVDYRWLEVPPDDRWLQREISRRLEARERSDHNKRTACENEILHERDQLIAQLAYLTGLSKS